MNVAPTPACPDCGAAMRVWRNARGSRSGRSHSFYAKATSYICPVNEAEVTEDARGHLSRAPNAKHDRMRVWTADEIEAAAELLVGEAV